MIAEVYRAQNTYYKNDSQPWADLHFNVELTQLSDKSSPMDIKERIDLALPENAWPTFLVSLTILYFQSNGVFQTVNLKLKYALLSRG